MRTIRTKMILQIMPAIFLVLAVSAIASVWMSINTQRRYAYRQAEETARRYADQFDVLMRADLAGAQTLAHTMERYTSANRAEVQDILHQNLIASPRLLGAYVVFEPNAFDGHDERFRKSPGSYPNGRFAPYWNRLKGKPALEPAVGAESMDWYQLPKRTMSCQVIGPYEYENVFMISFVCPIVRDGRFVGVAGVDIAPVKMDETVGHVRVFSTGYAFLVNREGEFVSYPKKAYIGVRNLDQLSRQVRNPALALIAKEIRAGREGSVETTDPISGKRVVMFYSPVKTVDWSMVLVAPVSEIYAEVNRLAKVLALISVLSLLFVGAIILAAARSITRPIAELRQVADRVAEGDLNVQAELQDGELGVLASAFNHMTSELRESLDSLRHSEEHFRSLIENASDIITVLDGEATVQYESPSVERVLGYKPDELVGHSIMDYIHPEDVQRTLDALSLVREHGARPLVELRIKHKDGSWRYLEATGCNRLADPSIHGIVINSRDVTKRKQAEQALQDSEQRFRAIFENSPYGITIRKLADEAFIMVNPAFERSTGFSSSEVIGKTYYDLGLMPFPEYYLEQVERLKRDRIVQNVTLRTSNRAGEPRYVLFSAVVVEIGGEECVIAVTADLTAEHRAEEALQAANRDWETTFNAISDAVWVLDLDHRITRTNKATADIFGVEPEEALGAHCWDVVHAGGPPPEMCPAEHAKHTLRRESMELQMDDRWFQITVDPVLDANGDLSSMVHIVRDITEAKRAEEALRASEEQFRQLTQQSPMPIAIYNDEGITEYVNDRFIEVFGYTFEDVPDIEHWWSLTCPDEQYREARRAAWREGHKEAIQGGPNIPTREYRAVCKDGSIRFIEVHSTRIGRRNLSLFSDVTDRKLAEQALRDSEEHFRSLTERSPMPIAIYNDQDILEYVNDQFTETFGYTLEDIPDMDHWWLLTCPDEQYREARRADWREGHENAMREGSSIPIREYQATCKDGSVRFIEVHGARIGNRNLSIISDVTDRRLAEQALAESEEHFRRVTQQSPIPICISNKRDEITYLNDSFIETFGYTLGDLPNVEAWSKLAYPDEKYRVEVMNAWREATERANEEHPAIEGHDYHVTCKDGSTRVVEISGTKIGESNLVLFNDITERKRAEEALRESTQRLADIINFLPDATFAIDLEGKVIAWNRAVEELTGVTADEMIGKGDLDYSTAFYDEKKPMLIGLVLTPNEESERSYPLLVRKDHAILGEAYSPVLKPSGRYLWGKASPLYDANGNIVGAIESVRDVTDRKLAEQALAESEERFRSLFENASDAVLVIDGMLPVECNSRTLEIYGCNDKSDILGVPLPDFAPPIQPDGSSSVEAAARYNAEALKGNVQRFLWKALRKDGTPIDVEVSLNSITLAGKTHLQAIARDVTERKRAEDALRRSEESYRMLYESMMDGFIACDLSGRVLAFNQAFSTMLGFAEEELRAKRYTDFTPERWHDYERDIIEQQVMKRGYSDLYEKEYVRKDGTTFPIELRTYALRDDKGNPTGMWAVIRDITDRRRTEDEKRQFYRETIRSATDGKLEISDGASIERYAADSSTRQPFADAAQLMQARQEAEGFCELQGMHGDSLGLFITGLGEAMTNALKHASGGQVFCGAANGELWVGVSDMGTGIATLTLPRATLQRGYSTKVSMGMGYSIMLDVSDRVMLSTGPSGTTVIMFKSLGEAKPQISLADLQDTWDAIPNP